MRALVVLSGGIAPVNKLEGTSTLPRCQKAVKLLQTGKYDILVLSGGQCHTPDIETQPAALTMDEYIASQDVTVPTTIQESLSRDTYENVAWSLKRLEGYRGPHEIDVVTHWPFALRVWLNFLLGHGALVCVKPVFKYVPLRQVALEVKSIAYCLCDWKGTKSLARNMRADRTWDYRREIDGDIGELCFR